MKKLSTRSKVSLVLVLALVFTFMASGLQDNIVSANEKTVLTVWAWDDNFNIPIMEKAGIYYSDIDSNITVNVECFSKEDVYTKLQTSLAAGGQGLPDIVLLEDYVSGKYLEVFEGSFANLSNDINYDDFLSYKVNAVSYKGDQYGVPLDAGPTSLFYRLDLVEEAGYTEEDMQNLTWKEFIKIGKDVKEKTNKYMIVETANNKTSIIRTMMQSAGLWYFDQNGEINIKDNPAIKEAFATLKKMKDEGILFEAESTGNRAGVLNDGTVASVVNGPWFVATLKAAPEQAGKWRIASIPRLTEVDGAKNASNVGGSSWYVLDNSKNKEEAISLLNTVFGGINEFYDDILVNQGALCAYKPAMDSSAYDTRDEFFGKQQIFRSFINTLNNVPPVNYGGYVGEANNAINVAVSQVLHGSRTIEEAIEQAHNQLKNQLGR